MDHKEYVRIVPGAETAILMIHGIAGTPRHFDFLLEEIPENVSVRSILLPGHGGTAADFAYGSMAQWKAAVQTALDALCQSHDRVILVGHSLGTLLAEEAAQGRRQVVGMLLLNVPLCVYVSPGIVTASLRWSFGKPKAGNVTDEGLKKAAGVLPEKRLWRYLSWLPRYWELLVQCKRSRSRFEALKIPSLVFQSQKDELVHRSTERYLKSNPRITCTELTGCGHYAYTENACRQVRQALKRLIQKEPME